MSVGAAALRSVLRAHASGVAVLTAPAPGGPAGMTITSLTSVSAEPALISFALADTSSTWDRIKDCGWFGVQLLGAHQFDVAERFAATSADRFAAPTGWHTGPYGVPLLDGCLSWLICSRYHVVRLGDHHLVVGAVQWAQKGAPGDSLVHVNRTLQPVPCAVPERMSLA